MIRVFPRRTRATPIDKDVRIGGPLLGYTPLAMLWRGRDGRFDPEWRRMQRIWTRPALIDAVMGEKG